MRVRHIRCEEKPSECLLFANAAANYGRTKKESYICRFADIKMAYLTRKRKATDPQLHLLFPEWSDGLCPDRNGPMCAKILTSQYGLVDGGRMFDDSKLSLMSSWRASAPKPW